MLTGKLLSDLLEGGIGGKTWGEYRNHWTGMVRYPWANEILTDMFVRADWSVHIHNFHNFKSFLDSNPYYKFSHTFPLPVTTEISKDFILRQSKFMNECYEDEIKYIHDIQAARPSRNTVHFICWDQFHYDIISQDVPNGHKEGHAPEDRFQELISQFDFNEPDALFWIFTDHGDWGFGNLRYGYPEPANYLTWACVKDNTADPLQINSRYISIRDFYPTMVNKFGLTEAPVPDWCGRFPITRPQDRDRILFVEDGRENIDSLHCTSAVACRFVDWIDDVPQGVLQVAYHKPADRFVGLRTSMNNVGSPTNSEDRDVDPVLKEALMSRIRWIK
jgi:hypothetical protein